MIDEFDSIVVLNRVKKIMRRVEPRIPCGQHWKRLDTKHYRPYFCDPISKFTKVLCYFNHYT